MVIEAMRVLALEYLVKILHWGRGRRQYIFTDSDPTALL
jgi:hypothetical protein